MRRAFDLLTPMKIHTLRNWRGQQTPKEIGLVLAQAGYAPGVWGGILQGGAYDRPPDYKRVCEARSLQAPPALREKLLWSLIGAYSLTVKGIRWPLLIVRLNPYPDAN